MALTRSSTSSVSVPPSRISVPIASLRRRSQPAEDSSTDAHGKLPLPAPAVVELLGGAELIERGTVELVTPTGAALLAANCDDFGPMPRLRLAATGYGAGSRDTEVPNVVRVLVGEGAEDRGTARQTIELIETNIDDMSPELVPYVIERLIDAGAVDAWVTPIQMKKARVGFLLSTLVDTASEQPILDVLFRETTTFGVRVSSVDREVLDRKEVDVEVGGYRVRLKVGYRSGEVITVSPEYEDAAEVARATGMPLREVFRAAAGRPLGDDHFLFDGREVARIGMIGCSYDQRRLLLGTDLFSLPAPRSESTTRRWIGRTRHVPFEDDALPPILANGIGDRSRRKQGLRVRHRRLLVHTAPRSDLDHLPEVHHRNPV